MLDKYLKSFSRLRADKNRKRWSALTAHHAPHKPFLLLSIMDLIAQGAITQNFIDPSFELGLPQKQKAFTMEGQIMCGYAHYSYEKCAYENIIRPKTLDSASNSWLYSLL